MDTLSIWKITGQATNDGWGGERVVYALSASFVDIPDPIRAFKEALPDEAVWKINAIQWVAPLDTSSAAVCADHPLTMIVNSMQE
jgi:hypothetical protein